ncbi:MAG: hypothetical protein EON98_01535 [Chitinophagaceae bacterium]|nr:MAG: hypothetical protein EON98_01535 [Chitinophagaceae bacterium]
MIRSQVIKLFIDCHLKNDQLAMTSGSVFCLELGVLSRFILFEAEDGEPMVRFDKLDHVASNSGNLGISNIQKNN